MLNPSIAIALNYTQRSKAAPFSEISDKGAAFLILYRTSFSLFPTSPNSSGVVFPIIRQQQIHDPAITFDTILLLVGFQIGIID